MIGEGEPKRMSRSGQPNGPTIVIKVIKHAILIHTNCVKPQG